jgi:hypothetical protein
MPVARYAVRIAGCVPRLTDSSFIIQLHDPENIAAHIPYMIPATVVLGMVSTIIKCLDQRPCGGGYRRLFLY